MTSDEISIHVSFAWDAIKRSLKKKGGVQAMAVLITARPRSMALFPLEPGTSKVVYATALQHLVAEAKPDMVVMIAEAWTVTRKQGITEKEFAEMDREGLSKNPDRREVLIVEWKTSDREVGSQMRELVRDDAGKPSLGKFIHHPGGGFAVSRFFDGLFEPIQ